MLQDKETIMAIIGAPFWNDRKKAYFTQENNAIEHVLKCRLPPGAPWLETCGPTASLNCQAALGRDLSIVTPGGYGPQPEDVLTSWFNDPRNFKAMKFEWPDLDPEKLPGNEVAQWYPLAVREVFGNPCDFVGALSFDEAVAIIRAGRTIQVCLDLPGHFVSLVAWDEDREHFIMRDSWAARWSDGDGFCRRLTRDEFEGNLRPLCLVYS
jgi:hypothetical protein